MTAFSRYCSGARISERRAESCTSPRIPRVLTLPRIFFRSPDPGRQRLHLAEALVNLFQLAADRLKGLADPALEGGLELLVDRKRGFFRGSRGCPPASAGGPGASPPTGPGGRRRWRPGRHRAAAPSPAGWTAGAAEAVCWFWAMRLPKVSAAREACLEEASERVPSIRARASSSSSSRSSAVSRPARRAARSAIRAAQKPAAERMTERRTRARIRFFHRLLVHPVETEALKTARPPGRRTAAGCGSIRRRRGFSPGRL